MTGIRICGTYWIGICVIGTTIGCGPMLFAATYQHATTDPEIEMWFYPFSTANGTGSVRDRGSTFSWYSPQDGFPDITGSGTDPIQRGTFIVASDTSAEIPRLAADRYRIDSVKLTLTVLGSIGSGVGVYDNTPDDYADVVNGTDSDPSHPVEMWGVGFDGDYTTFGFQGETEPQYFNEGDRRWPISGGSFTGPYQLYGIDSAGNDISNAVVGGYSATAPGNETKVFSPTPFAVGKALDELGDELTPGASYGAGTKFEFEPDLSDPGVVSYIQSSLAAGHLGFFFASLHQPNGHSGDVFYPDFYLDNVPGGPNPYGDGPTLAIEVTVLPLLPGDYDGNGTVDSLDYAEWKLQYGLGVVTGEGADGNNDGRVDAADYTVWRNNLGNSLNEGSGSLGVVVPEPASAALAVLLFGSMLGERRGRRR